MYYSNKYFVSIFFHHPPPGNEGVEGTVEVVQGLLAATGNLIQSIVVTKVNQNDTKTSSSPLQQTSHKSVKVIDQVLPIVLRGKWKVKRHVDPSETVVCVHGPLYRV